MTKPKGILRRSKKGAADRERNNRRREATLAALARRTAVAPPGEYEWEQRTTAAIDGKPGGREFAVLVRRKFDGWVAA
jgi:hypothetical protein